MAGARGRDGPATVRSADPRPEPAIPARPVERLESLPAEAARAEVRREIETGDVVAFARGGIARGERAVAVASEDRMQALGWDGLGQRAVRLSADTVRTHPRFRDFGSTDWLRVQRLVDTGEVIHAGTRHRIVWLGEGDGKRLSVLKRTRAGEIYLQSYRGTNADDIARLSKKRG